MEIKELLKKAIAYHPVLAETFGGIKEAVYLQQIIFWSDKGKREDGWIYKTAKDFEAETYIKKGSQERIKNKFINLEIIEIKIMKVGRTPKTHYKLNWEALKKILEIGLAENGKVKNPDLPKTGKSENGKVQDLPKTGKSSITENTTENTEFFFIFSLYKEKINPKARFSNSAKSKLKTRLKTFSVKGLEQAIINFSKTDWKMKHLSTKTFAWFLHTDDRIEDYINLPVNK